MPEEKKAEKVSVIMIARDEEDRLPATLASVAFAGEVVVLVDSATTDRTEEVARAAGARVLTSPFDGFGRLKNRALAAASRPWILSLDADEAVTPPLREEICRLVENEPDLDAYRVPIQLEFMGRALRFGRDTVVTPLRLFRKERARFSDDPVHERLIFAGPSGTLRGSVRHRSYRDLGHYMEKLDRYTTLAALSKSQRGKRFHAAAIPFRAVWEFLDRAVLRLGFLDGLPGLSYAALSSASTYVKYAKLVELSRKAPTSAR